MSRRLLAVLAAVPLFALTACGGGEPEAPRTEAAETTADAEIAEATESAASDKCGWQETYSGKKTEDTEGTPLDLMESGQTGTYLLDFTGAIDPPEVTCYAATITPEDVTVYEELPDTITTDDSMKTGDEGERMAAVPMTVANVGDHPPAYDGDGSFPLREALRLLAFEGDLDPFNNEIAWNTHSVVFHDRAAVGEEFVLQPGEDVDVHVAFPLYNTTDENQIYLRAGQGDIFNWAWELPVTY